MKTENDFEMKAQQAMESLDSFGGVEVPPHLEASFLKRLEKIQHESSRGIKWMWAAAVVLFLINGTVAYRFSISTNQTTETKSAIKETSSTDIKSIGTYYFSGGTSIYE